MLNVLDPNLLALIAAAFVASARTFYRAGLARLRPEVVNGVMSLVAVLMGSGFYWLEGGTPRWPLEGVLWFMGVGLCGSFAGRYLGLVSMNLVGLARSSVVSQTSLVWSAALAVAFLGERMTAPVAAGTLAIMFGTILLVREGGRSPARIPARYYLVPLLAAALFGLAHMSGKFGLRALPSAPLGMTASAATGLALMSSVLPFTEAGRNPRGWSRRGLATVAAGAVCNALAAWFFWSALKGGDLVTVVPINRLSVLVVIFFSWLFFRKQEAVTRRVVGGGALAVAGAFAVAWGR